MKLFVKLQDNEKSKEFVEDIQLRKLETRFEKLFIHLNSQQLELMIQGEFYLVSNSRKHCIEDDDFIYLMIENDMIKRLVIKED